MHSVRRGTVRRGQREGHTLAAGLQAAPVAAFLAGGKLASSDRLRSTLARLAGAFLASIGEAWISNLGCETATGQGGEERGVGSFRRKVTARANGE